MKFFTFGWWWDGQNPNGPNPKDASNAYRAHLDTIRDRLPADVLRLEGEPDEDVSIHDARLVALDLDVAARTLTLVLDGGGGDNGSGGARRFTLAYSGVRSFQSTQNNQPALPGPTGYGDLGYCEVHMAGDAFEHRFLFSTGIEWRVVFEGLELSLRHG